MEDSADDDELALQQGGRLFPIGQALRATYDADNHDTLGNDVAGLMINLSHVEPPRPAPQNMVVVAPERFARIRQAISRLWRTLRFWL